MDGMTIEHQHVSGFHVDDWRRGHAPPGSAKNARRLAQ